MKQHIVLHLIAKMLIPFIMLFALYVQFHGDYGPGGGFQAGVIFGAGVILYGIILGKEMALQVVPIKLVHTLAAVGVLLLYMRWSCRNASRGRVSKLQRFAVRPRRRAAYWNFANRTRSWHNRRISHDQPIFQLLHVPAS